MNELFVLLGVLVGYYMGRKRYAEDFKELRKRAGKAKAIITGKVPGNSAYIVHRPTADRLRKLNDKNREGIAESWDETVGQLPEIKEARKRKTEEPEGV